MKGYTMKYGKIVENENIIDEVLVSYFIAPNSYTRENVCEINSHGGIIVMKKILELCLKNGANLAEPGEFTKRAFLNGRIDLVQAEAVIDIINSKTEKEAKASVEQLQGSLSLEIKNIRKDLISMMADIEASIDYPEYDVEEVTNNRVIKTLEDLKEKLIFLEKSFDNGKILKEGIKTAIIGRPNAGKSSLLNILLNEERAIVTNIEGTTRDTIEEYISINGIPLKIIDTAGIREANDEVEKIGVEKAKKIAKESDIIIGIFDISKMLNSEDEEIIDILKNKNSIILLNKVDLNKENIDFKKLKETNKPIIKISTITKFGIKDLYNKIEELIETKEITTDNEIIVTNTRHKNLIIKAIESLNKSLETIENDMPIDIIVVYIKDILESLGKITGETVTEDIITEIFSKFCLGK
ncbi:MAG: tRNA uridine-5-carboxymethylaminomethyl(34) synthesis GTPase MnmE [Clostridia bacterium]|nr:tRNA uridine-5-carboxymethylaminomethyl(34) synthesis GTPase MnmE [Clostridia bacterium]